MRPPAPGRRSPPPAARRVRRSRQSPLHGPPPARSRPLRQLPPSVPESATRRPAARRWGERRRTEPTQRPGIPAPAGTGPSRPDVPDIGWKCIQQVLHGGGMIRRHDEDAAVGLDDDKILYSAQDHGVSLSPDNAVFRIVSISAAHQHIPVRVLWAYSGERLPSPDIVPGERASDHGDGGAALQQPNINRDRGHVPKELLDVAGAERRQMRRYLGRMGLGFL